MKKNIFLKITVALLFMILFQGCVQKAYKKTVLFRLHTNGLSKINTVGVRGGDKPLNWDNDFPLKTIKKDSLYEVAVTYVTGYKATEVKFVINNDFELQNQPNRRVVFSDKDTTLYEATFNQIK